MKSLYGIDHQKCSDLSHISELALSYLRVAGPRCDRSRVRGGKQGDESRIYFPKRITLKKASTLMSHLLLRSLAALSCLGVFSLRQTSAAPKPDQPHRPNFSGTWTLDLKASTSFESLMKQLGASFLERKYADSTRLRATLHQTEHVLTVAARGPAFALMTPFTWTGVPAKAI